MTEQNLSQELYRAIHHEDIEKVKELIANGVNVNEICNGFMPLNWAIGSYCRDRSNETIVRLLLEAGADVNYHDGTFSLICIAAMNNEMQMVRLLRKYGARFDFWTLFHCLWFNPVKNNVTIPVANFLKQYWPEFGNMDSQYFNYLVMIIYLCSLSVICFFLWIPFLGLYTAFRNVVIWLLTMPIVFMVGIGMAKILGKIKPFWPFKSRRKR